MNPRTQPPAAAPTTPATTVAVACVDARVDVLRAAAVEQVMRTCDDELALLPFLQAVPGTAAAAASLGRLLTERPQRLVAGCPLIALVTDGTLDPHWRDAYPARAESLFAHLDFLQSLYGPVEDVAAHEALDILRRRSETDLSFGPA